MLRYTKREKIMIYTTELQAREKRTLIIEMLIKQGLTRTQANAASYSYVGGAR